MNEISPVQEIIAEAIMLWMYPGQYLYLSNCPEDVQQELVNRASDVIGDLSRNRYMIVPSL
jgi:hypothetical protein